MTAGNDNQARLWLDQDHEAPEVLSTATGAAAVYSRRSPDKESANEDAAAILPAGPAACVLAVADGCGGMAAGDLASQRAVELLQAAVDASARDGRPLRAAILDGIEQADQVIRELAAGAATTLAVVEVQDAYIRTYHIGDSAVLLVGSHGKIKLLTRCHSPVGYAVEAGVISHEEAIHHEDRHIVSNVLGTLDAHIEIGPRRKMSPRDTLLIASDGVFDNLHLEEIVDAIRKGAIDKAASELAARAARRMESQDARHPSKPDDLTFILFRLN